MDFAHFFFGGGGGGSGLFLNSWGPKFIWLFLFFYFLEFFFHISQFF